MFAGYPRFVHRLGFLLPGLLVLAATGCGGGPRLALPPATHYEVTGTVLAEDGSPLADASVVLAGSPLGGLTEDDGSFRIPGVRAGTYRLTVIHLGYRSLEGALRVPQSDGATFTLGLVRDASLGPDLGGNTGPVTVEVSLRSRP